MSNMKRLIEEMEPVNNICERCGGMKTFYYAVQLVCSNGHTQGTPPPDVPVSNSSMRICACPLPKQEHNGNLDDYDTHDWRHASVHLHPDYAAIGSQLVIIYGRYADESKWYLMNVVQQTLEEHNEQWKRRNLGVLTQHLEQLKQGKDRDALISLAMWGASEERRKILQAADHLPEPLQQEEACLLDEIAFALHETV